MVGMNKAWMHGERGLEPGLAEHVLRCQIKVTGAAIRVGEKSWRTAQFGGQPVATGFNFKLCLFLCAAAKNGMGMRVASKFDQSALVHFARHIPGHRTERGWQNICGSDVHLQRRLDLGLHRTCLWFGCFLSALHRKL